MCVHNIIVARIWQSINDQLQPKYAKDKQQCLRRRGESNASRRQGVFFSDSFTNQSRQDSCTRCPTSSILDLNGGLVGPGPWTGSPEDEGRRLRGLHRGGLGGAGAPDEQITRAGSDQDGPCFNDPAASREREAQCSSTTTKVQAGANESLLYSNHSLEPNEIQTVGGRSSRCC